MGCYRKIIILVFFLLPAVFFSQKNRTIDSLENSLKKPGLSLKAQCKLYGDLCWEYNATDKIKAVNYGNLELQGGRELNNDTLISQAYHDLATVYLQNNDYGLSRNYYYRALLIRQKLNDKRQVAATLSGIAALDGYLGNVYAALQTNIRILKVFEELRDSSSLSTIEGNIGELYNKIKNYKKAIPYLLHAHAYFKSKQDEYQQAQTALNLSSAYQDMKDVELARQYLDEAYAIFLRNEAYREQIESLNYLAILMRESGQYDKSIGYYLQALKISEQTQSSREKANSQVGLGNIYVLLNDQRKAETYYLQALEIFKALDLKEEIAVCYKSLSAIKNKEGDLKAANTYLNDYLALKDTIGIIENKKQLEELGVKYETEKKEQENELLVSANQIQALALSKQKIILLVLIAVFVLIVVIALLLYSRYKAKQKALFLEEVANQEKLRFKAMLESEEKERMRIAKELHDGLGQLLSTARLNVAALNGSVAKEDEDILNTSLKVIDTACDEVRSISHNMMPVALMRRGLLKALEEMASEISRSHNMKAVLTADENIRFSEEKEIALYRIVQEVVNNMIKHAGATEISIWLAASAETTSLTITDNGKGFDTTVIERSTGLGWKNIFSRVALLNGTIAVDSMIGKGTKVMVFFPA